MKKNGKGEKRIYLTKMPFQPKHTHCDSRREKKYPSGTWKEVRFQSTFFIFPPYFEPLRKLN